ncbi:hypothetical protein F5Y02DRAFT_378812 [Annulohypoxylon stygium]|nr:hypothetical protein F5Y02DRAFT_378812 [Annulohypoxylon stygium]
MESLPVTFIVAPLRIFYLVGKLVVLKKRLPLPPGPRGIPLVGNVADLQPKGGIRMPALADICLT